ncbi:MAG: ABC transporter permease [Proteobacteria bacterium]|nr:ABC transporter permease [Pseudomonadota bacterium]
MAGTTAARLAFLPPPARFALRDLRGGLRGFYVFIACVALGVMAIGGVGSLASGVKAGLAREGRGILGGDLAFMLVHREADPQEMRFLRRLGDVSSVATLRAMARAADGRSALVELKAVDGLYPLFGRVDVGARTTLAQALAPRDGLHGAVADAALLTRLDLKPGDRLQIGEATIVLRGELRAEPDRLAGGIGFGPRLLIGEGALRASGLLQPGSLVRWHYRLRLSATGTSERAIRDAQAAAAREFPNAGWDVRTRLNPAPPLERNIERFTQYLTLVGLTVLLVGGVGVANAVKHYLDAKRAVIATLKALGATGAVVFRIFLVEVFLLSLVGVALGLALAAMLPFLVAALLGPILPLPFVAALDAKALALALAYGMLTAATFALWPLGRAHDVPVSLLFRDEVAPARRWPRRTHMALTAASVAALVALAVATAHDARIALVFVAAAAAATLLLRGMALAIMAIARAAPRARSTVLRLAVSNIHRPGALTPTVVLALGLGVALLVTVLQLDGNLRRQLTASLPAKSPSFFFLDIQSADAARFDALMRQQAPGATLERAAMLRGRIVSARGVRAQDIAAPPNARWVLQGDRGMTYASEVPAGSRVAEGSWWPPDYEGPPLVSMEKVIAEGLGLKVGDPLTVNVLGRELTATIANLRTLEWQSLGINFVLVYSPGAFRGAPHTQIATLTFANGAAPADETALVKAIATAFPAVTAVRVKEALDAVAALARNLALAVRGASAFAVLAAALVLGGALAAGHHHRVYDAVVLKTLGATRRQLIAAYALEYLMIGLATAVFGVAAGSLAAWRVVVDLMAVPFVWLALPNLVAATCALAVTVLFGLIGTFAALGQKPASVLRNL